MSKIELRDYQNKIVSDVRESIRDGNRRVLVTAPTGAGKTVIFSHISKGTSANGKRVSILVHRQELLDQTSRTLFNCGTHHGIIASSRSGDLTERVQVCSVQTLVRRLGNVPPPDVIIADEAHHATAGSWRKVIDAFPKAIVLGFSATPERLDGKGLNEVFEDMVRGPEVRDLIRGGHLCAPMYHAPPVIADLSNVPRRGGDYDLQALAGAMDKAAITGDAVEHYCRVCPGQPAVAFCVSIAHAEHVAEQFRAAGLRAATIDGTLSREERRQRVKDLGEGRLHVLTSCEIISEGFDLPIVAAAILLRPTQSLALHLQQIGRVLRPSPGKTRAIVLDHVGNTGMMVNGEWIVKHGLAEDIREWSLEGRKARLQKAKDADAIKTRQCPQCFCCHIWANECPECGRSYVADAREIEIKEGRLEMIAGIIDESHKQCRECHSVFGRWEASCPKCGCIADPVKARKKEQGKAQTFDELLALGKRKGYKNPHLWARHIIQARQRKEENQDTSNSAANADELNFQIFPSMRRKAA